MYIIKCDDKTLYDPRVEGLNVIGATCSLEVNKTGALNFSVPPTHPYYDDIKKHTSVVTLYQDDAIIFRGRVLNDEVDFNNIKKVECEGVLSYLIDSIQRFKVYQIQGDSNTNAVESYLSKLITNHNNQVDDWKQFTVGNVTVVDGNNYVYKQTNYENTLDVINTDLLGTYGGYIIVRYGEKKNYIDYVGSYSGTCEQKLEFGKNIIDMTRYIKGEDIYTALIPLGATVQKKVEGSSETVDEAITIKALPDSTDGTIKKVSDYIYDTEAVAKWGWIWGTYNWNDVTIDTNLLSNAKNMLKSVVEEDYTIDLTAIDLHLSDDKIERIRLGNRIKCISMPHNVAYMMLVNAITIDIDNPANTKIQLSLTEKQNYVSTSKTITQKQKDTEDKIKNVDKKSGEDYVTKDYIKDNYVPKDYANDNYVSKDYVDDNYVKKGESVDLSDYAKIEDVNTAFNELASALSEV